MKKSAKYGLYGILGALALGTCGAVLAPSHKAEAASPIAAPALDPASDPNVVNDAAKLFDAAGLQRVAARVQELRDAGLIVNVTTAQDLGDASFPKLAHKLLREGGALSWRNDGTLMVLIAATAPEKGSPFTVAYTNNEPLKQAAVATRSRWDSAETRKLHADGKYAKLASEILAIIGHEFYPDSIAASKLQAPKPKQRRRLPDPSELTWDLGGNSGSGDTGGGQSVNTDSTTLDEAVAALEIDQVSATEVRRIALAIRDKESGGDYQAHGKSGEYGAYQFMPTTWQMCADAYLPGVRLGMTQATPLQQDYVAARRIAEFVAAGNSAREIALLWNGGSAREKSGVNSWGVPYDTGAYADAVMRRYNAIQ